MKSKMRLHKITKNNKEYYGHFVCVPVPHVKRSETAERKSREIWFRLFTRYQTQASPVFLLLCYLSCRLFSRLASLTVRLEQAIHISGSKQQNQSSCTAILLPGIAKRRLQCITIILAFGTNKNRIATEAVI